MALKRETNTVRGKRLSDGAVSARYQKIKKEKGERAAKETEDGARKKAAAEN